MKDYQNNVYNTIIIGSGYTSVGYALSNKNTLILEQSENADTTFYLALTNFNVKTVTAKTLVGKELLEKFSSHNLFKDGAQCLNAFECALCDFILDKGVEILFKTRVLSISEKDNNGIITLTVLTVSGIQTLKTNKLIDARYCHKYNDCSNEQQSKGDCKNFWTVLLMTDNPDVAKQTLLNTFNGAIFENAYFEGRYALHIPIDNFNDFNQMKIEVFDKWTKAKPDCKILYFAPTTFAVPTVVKNGFPIDCEFDNPISAIDSGYNYALNGKGVE